MPSEGTREPFLIGVCGGTASGKTTVCDRIMHQLQERRVVLISQARGMAQAPGLAGLMGGSVGADSFDRPRALTLRLSPFGFLPSPPIRTPSTGA